MKTTSNKTTFKPSAKFILNCSIFIGASILGSVSFAKPYVKVFPAKYDTVWKSTLIAVTQYPLEKNDKSSGEITTSSIEAGQIYRAYNSTPRLDERYSLNISLEKRRLKGKAVTLVKIEKKPILKGNFMREVQSLESDGIEESVLLYRIAREVVIDRKLEKLFK